MLLRWRGSGSDQLRKKTNIFIILRRIKQNTKQMLLKGGVATPSTPPLDPPLMCLKIIIAVKMERVFF